MTSKARAAEIAALDAKRDAQRIVHLLACYDFPWDMTRSLEIALFRTFCIPSISGLLDHTGEFRDRAQKRYDDTDILISQILETGYDSDLGRRALGRINQQHGRFSIANEDFLYVLSTFVFEPIRWNREYGWRHFAPKECEALFHFWRGVGQAMGIREIPENFAGFERFSREYEACNIRYAESNQRVGNGAVAMFCAWFPGFCAPFVRGAIIALLDDHTRIAFGFETPPKLIRQAVPALLRLRAGLVRLLPKRRRPRLRTLGKHRSYPAGYRLESLGPPGT